MTNIIPAKRKAEPVILITGAAGRIGGLLRRSLRNNSELERHYGRPYGIRVADILDPGPGEGDDDVHVGNLADAAFVDSLFADGRVEAVIHMAGYPREAGWDVLLDANIHATINLWEAALRTGTDRMLFASSNHAIGLYPREQTIDDQVPQRPDSRYGLTKVFGEELGFLYAYKHGLRAFSMRIGSFLPEPNNHRALSTFLSHPDMTRLAIVGLTADYLCETVYGVSNNARSFWDNSAAHRLGYRPQDSADSFADRFPDPEEAPADPARHFQGGAYVPAGLTDPDLLNDLTRARST